MFDKDLPLISLKGRYHVGATVTSMGLMRTLLDFGIIEDTAPASDEWKCKLTEHGRAIVQAWYDRWPVHWMAKLSETQVRDIRKRWDKWQKIKSEQGLTLDSLAEEFGVSNSCISGVVRRETYVGVE
jgi:hypothetical protein